MASEAFPPLAPSSHPPLDWLRGQIVARRCAGLAAGIEHAIAEAHRPPVAISSAVPVRRAEIRAAEPLLRKLAARLRDGDAITPSGVATAKRLLTDGNGPMFAPSAPGALLDAVEAAILALDNDRTQTT